MGLPSHTRLARAIDCIRVCAFNGLSRYRHESDFTSKPVSHMAQTNTMRRGFSRSLYSLSSSRVSNFLRCGMMSLPHFWKYWISFCSCEMTTAISVSFIHESFSFNTCTSCWLLLWAISCSRLAIASCQ